MSENLTAKIIKVLLYLTVLTPIILPMEIAFPYITTRTAVFRVLMEIAAIFLLWLLLKGKARVADLKQNYFFWAFGALLLVELVAAFAGKSFSNSFFSNLERMWGVFTAAHLFIFYFLLRSFFGPQEWKNFFHYSFVVSLIVGIYGIIQREPAVFNIELLQAGQARITSTLGNPSYVAIYLLFNIAFAIFFLIKNRQRPIKFFYFTVAAVDASAFIFTDIRGTYLGLLGGLGLAMLLYLFLGANKKYKIAFSGLLAVGILLTMLIVFLPQKSVFKNVPILGRLSTISLTGTTVQTRFMSWNAAWEGFKENPILGVGMENFGVLFNQHFRASYYNLAPTETYFDRAHNQYLNILAESGILALLLYLAQIFLVGYYLIRCWKEKKLELFEFLILAGLFTVYFIHIFFVFDDLHSLLFFIVAVSFLEYHYRRATILATAVIRRGLAKNFSGQQKKSVDRAQELARVPAFKFLGKTAAVVLIFVLILSVYFFNIKVLKAANLSARAQMSRTLEEHIKFNNQALNLDAVSTYSLVNSYMNYLSEISGDLALIKDDKNKLESINSAIQGISAFLEKSIAENPYDAFLYLKLAEINNFAYVFYGDQVYFEKALAAGQHALELSPERLQILYVLSESYVVHSENNKAREMLDKASELNSEYGATYYYLGRVDLTDGNSQAAYKNIIEEAMHKRNYLPQGIIVLTALSQDLAEQRDYEKVAVVYNEILRIDEDNATVMAGLAAAYVQLDNYKKAIMMAEKAAQIDPDFKDEAKIFVDYINSGRIAELKEITR